ncbi:ribonuclease H-like domain-containing protein [Hypoxylon argillaceum]|nr:ribonuclease H-like domain-containing protein [Hypoxylon argillaceum]
MSSGRGGWNPRAGGGGGGGGGGGNGRRNQGGFYKPTGPGSGSGSRVFSSAAGTPAPDKEVIKVENALLASRSAAFAGLSLGIGLPMRPSYGTKGTSVTLWANYFLLQPPPKMVLYQYDLSVNPKVTGKKLAHIVRLFLQSPELQGSKQHIVTDFKSIIISKVEIEDQTIKDLPYIAEGEDEPREDARKYDLTLEQKKVLSVADLISYLASPDLEAQPVDLITIVQALNILVNHHAKSSSTVATIGSSKNFSLVDAETSDLGVGVRAIRGYFTSVRAATARLLLNVNVNHSAFYQPMPLDELMRSFLRGNSLFKLGQFLKRLRIKTTHLKERKNRSGQVIVRAKTICGFASKDDGKGLQDRPEVRGDYGPGAKDVSFFLKPPSAEQTSATPKRKGGKPTSAQSRYISIYDYFKSTYNIVIKDPSLPIVNVGTASQPSYLPAQVCVVLPGQPMGRTLGPSQAQKMIQFAVRGPADNARSIVSKGLQIVGLSNDKNAQLNKFGITVSPNLITVQARLLAEPKVVYGSRKQARTMGGSWNMVPQNSTAMTFYSSENMPKWSCLSLEMPDLYPQAPKFDEKLLDTLVDALALVLKSTGIECEKRMRLRARALELKSTDDNALEQFFVRAVDFQVPLLIVILPAGPIPLYNRVKYLGDVKYGIHTICAIGSKFERGDDQYLRNIALKVNLKIGGDNHLVEPSALGLISEDKTMIVGMDVTHPSPGSADNAPSVSAMVASINSKLTRWPGTLGIQDKSRQEMVSNLRGMLKSRLELWRTMGGHASYPENILVYRDGVSEGQYDDVLETELPQLREACREVYPANDQKKGLPRMTIIVVGKRHHTRFYTTKESDADRSGNTKAGTVVDRGVTLARNWDFFLQSHAAIKGTARPAHYIVLLDEIFRPRYAADRTKNVADELQMITQSMCYVFGRATKAVSYCAPAYYADILCERARCYLHEVFESPTNSAVPSVAASDAASNTAPSTAQLQGHQALIRIHNRLKNTMFYI